MTDCPSTDVDTLNSRIDDNEAHLSLRNPSPVSRNRRSQQEPRYEKESLGDGKEREMQPPESNLSSHLIDAAGRHISDTATIAFAALLHIPSPLLVLSNRKTVVVANYAIEELLGLDTAECDEETRAPDGRQGKSLSQLGIQLVQDEHQNQVSWEVRNTGTIDCGLAFDGAIGVSRYSCRRKEPAYRDRNGGWEIQ